MNNILYLHNGNIAVKKWAERKNLTHKVMPCVTDEWNIDNKKISSIDDKIEFLKSNNNIIFDLSSADILSNVDLYRLSVYCKVLKIFTTYTYDLDNLEEVWLPESYTYDQWITASINRVWAADQIIYFKESVNLLADTSVKQLVFTPGRCGTHVLKSIINISEHYHHDKVSQSDPTIFTNLTNSMEIFSVLRKSFVNQVTSDAIAFKIKLVLVSKDNTEEETQRKFNKKAEIFKNKNLTLTEQDIQDSFDKIANYADMLISLKILWNKKIKFCYYEDLSDYFDSVNYIKNPYDAKTIITNYNEIKDVVLKEYQPAYQRIMNRIEQSIGLSIY
jgi:hypothetical protein